MIHASPEAILDFGRLKHRCDRADFHDWLEVLEFLQYLQTVVQEGAKPDVVDTPREELADVIATSIDFWEARIEMGFLGVIWIIKQFVGLRQSLKELRCALEKMGMIDPAGSPMKPAKNIRFISDVEAGAGSDEPLSEHFPNEYLTLVPSYAIVTEKDSSVERKWREWSSYDWWVHASMNSFLLDVPLWHKFRNEVLPGIVANRPVEGEALLNYIRSIRTV